MRAVFFIGRWAANILLACLAIASSVKPEDAMSNISGWATKFNLPDPAWLQSHTADSVIFWGAVSGVFALSLGPIAWHWVRPRSARVFVPRELTPERLLSFFQDNTDIHATELTKDRIGQWIPFTGTVRNVGPFNGYLAQVSFERNYVQPRTWFDGADIYCYFRRPQVDRLKVLKRGDKITVIGEISRIRKLNLELDNCEFVDPGDG
jgi:hypothetical protein